MFISLQPSADAAGLQAWLLRSGHPSRLVARGRAILVDDPFVPPALKQAIADHPDVADLEETHDLPRLALGAMKPQLGIKPQALLDVGPLPLVAGPCAVESRDHIFETAEFLSKLGVRWLRGGTAKTRTRTSGFQGAGVAAAGWLREAADAYGLRCLSEVPDDGDLGPIAEQLDLIQIGARHMHVPRFLTRVGKLGKPVLLKRGFAATPEEWLWAAEYLLEAGAPTVAFCERGLRTAAPLKRFTLDLAAVPFIKAMTPFPIWVDPSHAAGSSPYVAPLARAAIACGAAAVVVECHPNPERACSDAAQALDFEGLAALAADLRALAQLPHEKAGAR